MHWNGTVLRILAKDILIYLTMVIYISIRLAARYGGGVPTYLGELGSGNLSVIGGFLSFFLVFYVNQSHARFFRLYHESMTCKGRIFDVAALAKTTLPPARATRLVRYMNAAHIAGYVGLSSETYPCGSFFRHMNDNLGLLTDKEMARMRQVDMDAGGSCHRELIVWCMNEIQSASKCGELQDSELINTLRDHVLRLRAAMGQLYE